MPSSEPDLYIHIMEPTAYVGDMCNRVCVFAFFMKFHTFNQIFKWLRTTDQWVN